MCCVQGGYQASLFAVGEAVETSPLALGLERIDLGSGAWIELCRSWIVGADLLFDRLVDRVPWRSERRLMYDRVVDVPRLASFYGEADELPDERVRRCREELRSHYLAQPGGDLRTTGMCLYRNGDDSVAWHGDRLGRASREDVIVAIVSLGAARTFAIRPTGGGVARRFVLSSGDLIVMGGSCQRTFEHCVPKSRRVAGPRMSLQFRPIGVR